MNYMVITKFDYDLEFVYSQNKRKFSLQTIVTIGVLMLDILEKFHNMGYVHNDMKPQNIMTKMPTSGPQTGAGNSANQLFLIDFGLTTAQSDHSKYKFKGTPYFASNSALQKIGTGPKDDVESLMYILVYLYMGELPWPRDLPVLKDDIMSNMAIQNCINARNPYALCCEMEPEFAMMLSHLQELSHKKKPNYKMLRSQFEVIKERHHLKYQLEWASPGNKEQS